MTSTFTVGVQHGTKVHFSTIHENVVIVVTSYSLHHAAYNHIDMFTLEVFQKNSDSSEKYFCHGPRGHTSSRMSSL
jgi:hypothetical protein